MDRFIGCTLPMQRTPYWYIYVLRSMVVQLYHERMLC